MRPSNFGLSGVSFKSSPDKEETAKSLFSGVGIVEQVTQSLYDRMIELKGQAKREEHHEEPRDTGGAQFAEATFSVYLSRKVNQCQILECTKRDISSTCERVTIPLTAIPID